MIVVDANILIRAVMGRRVKHLLETYSAKGIHFYAPGTVFAEAEKYLPILLAKRGKPAADVVAAIEYFRTLIEPVDHEFYDLFETEARRRLQGRDENDWPVLATALGLDCPVWTEDKDFFGTGIAAWTTSRVEIFLEARAKEAGSTAEGE